MNNVLHVYGQEAWHDDLVIAGTRDALESLVKVLQDALAVPGPRLQHTFFVTDGEGFRVRVVEITDDPKYAVPYTSSAAVETRDDAVWPGQEEEKR